jgi:hypothetical protein
MTAIAANTIRLACDYTAVDDMVDANTNRTPVGWRSLPLNVQFALFAGTTIVDSLANVESVTLRVKDADTPEGMAYLSETLAAASLTACTSEAWTAGTGQHGIIPLSAEDMALPAARYWAALYALLTDGTEIKVGKFVLDLRASGVTTPGSTTAYLTSAQADARYLRLNLPGATFRASADGKHLYLWSTLNNAWREFHLDADDGFALGAPVEP